MPQFSPFSWVFVGCGLGVSLIIVMTIIWWTRRFSVPKYEFMISQKKIVECSPIKLSWYMRLCKRLGWGWRWRGPE